MSSGVALAVCTFFILWLLARDRKRRQGISAVLWIPTLWLIILGSRPVSAWFGLTRPFESPEDYLEGSPLDRIVFQCLILAGFLVLLRRRTDWGAVVAKNRWLAVYLLYFGVSVLWSDYPFTAFKRWIKDIGNVIMALIILSEEDPIEAIKAVFARCLYLLIPLSVLFIKYYSEIGVSYDQWVGEQFIRGVAFSKNSLGGLVAVCTLFFVWELLQVRKRPRGTYGRIDWVGGALLLGMCAWLLKKADSATSLSVTVLGCAALVTLGLPPIRRRLHYILVLGAVGALMLMFALAVVDLGAIGLKILGRDATLTGRTEIWRLALAEDINPVLGTGFYSFWTGARVTEFWEAYSFHLNQAHNGYLETYLNGGLVGLGLLLAMLISAGLRIKQSWKQNFDWAGARLVIWSIVIIHNWTEATYNRLTPIWFALLVVIVEYHRRRKTASTPASQRVPDNARKTPRHVESPGHQPFSLGWSAQAGSLSIPA